MLSGYKTYITAGLAILGAAAAYLTGEMMLNDAIQLAVTAALAAFVRNSIPAK